MVDTSDMKSPDSFLTVKEYAYLLGIHANTVRRSIKTGRLHAFKVGSGKRSEFRIPRTEINRMAFEDLEKILEAIVSRSKQSKA